MAKKNKGKRVSTDPVIELDQAKSIDNLGLGMYRIEDREGSVNEVSLDEGEAHIVEEKIRGEQDHASEGRIPSAGDIKDDPRFSNAPLERNLGSSLGEVEYTHPDMRGFWADQDDISKYRAFGYHYAEPRDVKDFERRFSEVNPGQGLSPDGYICKDGHTLLVATKEIAQKRHDYYFNKRVRARDIQGNLSTAEIQAMGMKI